MQNILMLLAASGLFYTALSSTLYDMTVTDCNAGIELACKEVNKWLHLYLLHVIQGVNAMQGQRYNALTAKI